MSTPELKPSTQFAVPVRHAAPGLLKPWSGTWFVFFTLLACGIFLYLQLFVLPATPRVAVGDQSIYLHSATRMYEGQLIYRDYDYFTLPGTDVLYFTLFKLFGVRAWIPQMMLLLVGVMSAWLSFKIARKVMNGPAVFLPGFLFLTLPFTSYLDASHHLYSVLAATSALAVVIEERTATRLAWAGVLWGLGTCFTQSLVLGPAALGLFVVWEHHREKREKEDGRALLQKEGYLLASYVATVAAFNAYFVWKVGLKQFLNYTVTFVAKYFSTYEPGSWRTYMIGWPSVHAWANWPDLTAWPLIHFLIPLIYILFFVRYWRERRLRPDEPWERLMLINVTGLSLFLMIASAPAWNRLYTVSLPALIMLVWFLNSPSKLERILIRILWVSVLVLAIVRPIVTQTRWKAVLDLPTGRTAFFEHGVYEETKWVLQRTHPADYFFGDQLLCFDLRLRNPSRVLYITPYAFTRPEQVRNVVQELEERQVRFVGWYHGLDDPTDAQGNYLGPLRGYMQSHYHVAGSFANGTKIWERSK
jgi:Dolichyl-phosphate-mannose-protein mannosyltransferase